MDSLPTYDNFPWELIVSALQGNLAPDEELLFQEWLTRDQKNREHYEKLQQMWKEGLTDYIFYRQADAAKAWEALRQRIGSSQIGQRTGSSQMVSVARSERAPVMRRWMAAAAIFLLLAGAGWQYFARQNAPLLYETAGEQKNMTLPDGSLMVIGPRTRIRVTRGFNHSDRLVVLDSGKAQFTVTHQAKLPFMVDVDVASIKDIGTTFTVQKTTDSIRVTVSSGKVAFIQKATGESHDIAAGRSLVFYPMEHRFSDIRPAAGDTPSMRFYNAPLSDVIAVLQETFNKKITIIDTTLGRKRLTADLNGLSYGDAIKIVCASLNLDYAEKNGSYFLTARDSPARKH
jgi:transmembrane sensor